MTRLSLTLKEERWELAACWLLLGLFRAAAAIPADSLAGLLEVVASRGRKG